MLMFPGQVAGDPLGLAQQARISNIVDPAVAVSTRAVTGTSVPCSHGFFPLRNCFNASPNSNWKKGSLTRLAGTCHGEGLCQRVLRRIGPAIVLCALAREAAGQRACTLASRPCFQHSRHHQ